MIRAKRNAARNRIRATKKGSLSSLIRTFGSKDLASLPSAKAEPSAQESHLFGTRLSLVLAGYTAGMELHQTPKIMDKIFKRTNGCRMNELHATAESIGSGLPKKSARHRNYLTIKQGFPKRHRNLRFCRLHG